MRDPFSKEADPLRDEAPRLGRRTLVFALAVLPAATSACAHPHPACPTLPEDAEHCRHRFCRHHRG